MSHRPQRKRVRATESVTTGTTTGPLGGFALVPPADVSVPEFA